MNISKKIFGIVLLLTITCISTELTAQPRAVRKAEKKQERTERKKKKKQKKADKAFIKHHISIQEEDTQKRMKANRKRSDKHNDTYKKDEPFFKKIFKKKNKRKKHALMIKDPRDSVLLFSESHPQLFSCCQRE